MTTEDNDNPTTPGPEPEGEQTTEPSDADPARTTEPELVFKTKDPERAAGDANIAGQPDPAQATAPQVVILHENASVLDDSDSAVEQGKANATEDGQD